MRWLQLATTIATKCKSQNTAVGKPVYKNNSSSSSNKRKTNFTLFHVTKTYTVSHYVRQSWHEEKRWLEAVRDFFKDNLNLSSEYYPAGKYMFKFNTSNVRTRCEICSKLTIQTSERRQWRRSGVFIVNFEYISHLFLVFLLLTLSREMSAG